MSVRVFIQRTDGGEDGPYGEEEVLDALAAGELSPLDWCRIDDEPQAQRLGEVFEAVPTEEKPENGNSNGEEDEDLREETDRIDASAMEEDGEDAEDADNDDDEEEVLVYRGSPSVLAYASTFGVAAGVLAAGYWAGQFGVKWVTGGLVVSLFLVVRVLLHRGGREYVVTSRGVQSTTGWLSKSTRRLSLAELTAIRLHRGGLMGWLGVGTIVFSGRGGPAGDVVFERVGRARRVIARVREWQGVGRK